MEYSLQPVIDLAEICALHGLRDVILSPGSRCAPLVLAFVRHGGFRVKTISDERAAAFVALGMAQQTATPVILVCTSGTAAANYLPAIAEAFYQQVPLLVLTADRPAEWIDQWDGQTIRQQGLYGAHVLKSFQLPADYGHADAVWHLNRSLSEAILLSRRWPGGPVHLNVPLREPFYPQPGQVLKARSGLRIFREHAHEGQLSDRQAAQWRTSLSQFAKVLVVCGQQQPDEYLRQLTSQLALYYPVVSDIISNHQQSPQAIRMQDWMLGTEAPVKAHLQPELLITFGKSLISKNLKIFLRRHPALVHWHVQPDGDVPDTFQALHEIIRCTPEAWIEQVMLQCPPASAAFHIRWQAAEQVARQAAEQAATDTQDIWAEPLIVHQLLRRCPAGIALHLANSMSVRYANFWGLAPQQDALVWANRGTSGIDGCTSTAVGHALSDPERLHVLLTGDLAFFYDRNALWQKYLKNNLRIVLLNNHGGVIFRMIEAGQLPELEEYFETEQPLDAARTAADFGLEYHRATDRQSLEQVWNDFWNWNDRSKILEIQTGRQINKDVLGTIKKQIQKALDNL